MAQTTGAMSGANAKVEYSIDIGTPTWVDISGFAATVSVSGGEQITGNQQTFMGNSAIVTGANKVEPVTIEVTVVYTDTDSEPFDALFDRFMSTTKTAAVRYSPNGGASGDEQYTTANDAGTDVEVPIVTCNPPDTEAASGEPRMFTFSVIAPRLAKSAVA